MNDNRVELDTAEYYCHLKEGTRQEQYLELVADSCITMMDLIDSCKFDLSDDEANSLRREMKAKVEYLKLRTKDRDD